MRRSHEWAGSSVCTKSAVHAGTRLSRTSEVSRGRRGDPAGLFGTTPTPHFKETACFQLMLRVIKGGKPRSEVPLSVWSPTCFMTADESPVLSEPFPAFENKRHTSKCKCKRGIKDHIAPYTGTMEINARYEIILLYAVIKGERVARNPFKSKITSSEPKSQ